MGSSLADPATFDFSPFKADDELANSKPADESINLEDQHASEENHEMEEEQIEDDDPEEDKVEEKEQSEQMQEEHQAQIEQPQEQIVEKPLHPDTIDLLLVAEKQHKLLKRQQRDPRQIPQLVAAYKKHLKEAAKINKLLKKMGYDVKAAHDSSSEEV